MKNGIQVTRKPQMPSTSAATANPFVADGAMGARGTGPTYPPGIWSW